MIENRGRFIDRIAGLGTEDFRMVMYAYDMAKYAHGHMEQVREGDGQRYFEHPRSVTLIMIDEVGVFDPNILSASLLHDVPEDTGLLGNPKDGSYREWREIVTWRISRSFNPDVARIVLDVTKPYIDGVEIRSEGEGLELYFNNLRNAEEDSIMVKMGDRLHNLRTMDAVTPEKRVRKIKETEDYYLDIFKRGRDFGDGQVYEQLIRKIEREIERNKLMRAS